ncbi:MAG: NUDIX hydrolase, partial [Anaerolineales bacterium]|nr:NUDIX hydrolase [Anaerolineales bacterium]
MASMGVNVAIIENGKVLLTQREDFEYWVLPGGGAEAGETLAQAARREAQEETGLEVELTRMVGFYYRPSKPPWGGQVALFAARPV